MRRNRLRTARGKLLDRGVDVEESEPEDLEPGEVAAADKSGRDGNAGRGRGLAAGRGRGRRRQASVDLVSNEPKRGGKRSCM